MGGLGVTGGRSRGRVGIGCRGAPNTRSGPPARESRPARLRADTALPLPGPRCRLGRPGQGEVTAVIGGAVIDSAVVSKKVRNRV